MKNIPKPILEFIFFDYPHPIYEINYGRTYFFSWKDFFINLSEIREILNKLSNILHKCNLEVKTLYYVSTRGGETRNCYIIFPCELKDFCNYSAIHYNSFTQNGKINIQ